MENAATQNVYGDAGAREALVGNARSAVAWAPIIAGSVAASALSLILLALGSGLGFASVSPWSGAGATATTFTIMTAIWFVIIQWLSSGLGGYLAGRLRTKRAGIHGDEVFFRDTAHGFLTWSLSTILVGGLLFGGASAVIGGSVRAVTAVAGGAVTAAASQVGPSAYFVDMLFRPTGSATSDNDTAVRTEVGRILANGLGGEIGADDRSYLAKIVAAKTGLSQTDAESRIATTLARIKEAEANARQAADQARKAAATAALLAALALAIGALIGAAAAALGGAHRDEWSEKLAPR